MDQNVIGCDRGQVLLLPPSLSEWLPEDHLAWTVLGAVGQMDLAPFYGGCRANRQAWWRLTRRRSARRLRDRNRSYESIVTEILQDAERVDCEEDGRHGGARGDELPEQLRTREGRRAALKAAREKLPLSLCAAA